jgi:uncharacterized protein YraI
VDKRATSADWAAALTRSDGRIAEVATDSTGNLKRNKSLETLIQPKSLFTRRQALRLALAGAAVVAAGTAVARSASADATGFLRTTSALNLRTGPSLDRRIILVLPENVMVTDLGAAENGFRYVSYQGTDGWAFGEYLVDTDGGSSDEPEITGAAITSTDINLRSGPSTDHQVLRVVVEGSLVHTSSTVENGFRYVVHGDLAGWMYEDYLLWNVDGPVPATVTTTSDLNLRKEPSLSAPVLAVMPEGTAVRPTGAAAYDFAEVVYGALTGWAHTSYLN